jgi:cell division protein FtsL
MAIFPSVKFKRAILPYIIIISSHFFIDWIRRSIDKKFSNKLIIFASFIVDQILHILILAILYYAFDLNSEITSIYEHIQQWSHFNSLIIYVLTFVIIWDPAAVFIKKLFLYMINEDSCVQEENNSQIGRIIGKLERVIISVLVLCNQFGAIGFVLTAKSIARYKQLEDKNFAEKYLVGTLTSTSIAIIITIILKQLL